MAFLAAQQVARKFQISNKIRTIMNKNYFLCELCGFQLMHIDSKNQNKFPVTRRFQNNDREKELLTIRCAECARIPYFLEEGNPSRARLFNADNVTILQDFNSRYNYWSYGIGHLLELYTSVTHSENINYFRQVQIELGFFVESDVNMIIFAYRLLPDEWLISPFQWCLYEDFAHAVPPLNPLEENERKFSMAVINETGGKYLVIREFILPLGFARKFHSTIHQQIERGKPDNLEEYRNKIETLYEYLIDNKVDSMLFARTLLEGELL